MTRVRIIGGGLTGVLAAFEAHRLGFREIILHERFDRLGGVTLPKVENGLELRTGCVYFGPARDPVRQLLEWHGVEFEEFENRFGSVSPGQDGQLLCIRDFAGPALPARQVGLAEPTGESLADRLRAYPADMQQALTRYCQWRLGAWLDQVHGSAAAPLAVNRVYPIGGDVSTLAELKRTDALYDELYAIPRDLWGRTSNLAAALPRGGFAVMFETCRRRLESLGVAIHDTSLVSPREALAARDEVVVWAANPMPLFKAAGLTTPRLVEKSFTTYVFKAKFAGPTPFYVQNFTATGAAFRIYLYESRGETLVAAECVAEAPDAELRREIHRLMAGFGGETLALGEQIGACVDPRRICNSVEAVKGLGALREQLARTHGARFVPGAWEPDARPEKFAQVNAGLAAALAESQGVAATAVAA
jgi:hypothetical protein